MSSPVPRPLRRQFYLRQWVPFAVLVLGGVLTGAAVVNIATRQRAAMAATFSADTLTLQRAAQFQLDTVVGITRAASALLGASPEINFIEFKSFVSGLELRKHYPGVNGIGFAARVQGPELRTFVKAVSLDGIPKFTVWPSGTRSEYVPAVMLDPPDADNNSLIGFDLASDPTQRVTMEQARDGNASAITPLTDALLGKGGREMVLYLPIYRSNASVASVAERRRALVGFVFSRLQPDAILSDSLAEAASRSLALSVYDGSRSPDALLAMSGEPQGDVRSVMPLSIGGREWLLYAGSRDATVAGLPPEAQRVLATGIVLSLLLFAIVQAQVRAWQTAERHAAELVAGDRAKDEFLAVLSHELRTPLNAMLGWLSMLRSGSLQDDRRMQALEIVERNARAQAQLIDDLLEVSRIMMGKMRLDKRPLSVIPALSTVVDSLRPVAEAKGVSLHGVERADTNAFVIDADPGRFNQIITNLVSNGVKFTPAGGAVWVNIEQAAGAVQIFVGDTGIGIAPDFLPFVFDRFRQADASTTRSHGGLGMGLAIVRDLVRMHGGTIEAFSKGPQQGALFVLTFPLITADGPPASSDAKLALADT
jgi:signal transduction histidine kinase